MLCVHMNNKLIIIVFAIIVSKNFAQIGIKTHIRPSQSNLQNDNIRIHMETVKSEINRESEQIINKTISTVPPGICFEEVPTLSLINNKEIIPAGNGSDPSLSRIQVCCEGYTRNIHNFRKCDPICNKECVNGLCIAPDVCKCYPDHIRNLGGYCIPICPIGCANGECDGEICQCKSGFVLALNRKFCIPHCHGGCRNGNCTEPNTCTCMEGYELTLGGKCTPICDNCTNGECVAPGMCSCLPGYQRNEDRWDAICKNGCENGICSAPNICTCNPGYSLDPTGIKCVAHCQRPCLNGICTGANICSCNRGYVQDTFNPNQCKPFCPNGCPNGVCSSPNYCICKPGFIKDRSLKGSQVCIPSV